MILPETFVIVISPKYVFSSEHVHLIIHVLQPEILLVHTIAVSKCILRIDMTFLQLIMKVI